MLFVPHGRRSAAHARDAYPCRTRRNPLGGCALAGSRAARPDRAAAAKRAGSSTPANAAAARATCGVVARDALQVPVELPDALRFALFPVPALSRLERLVDARLGRRQAQGAPTAVPAPLSKQHPEGECAASRPAAPGRSRPGGGGSGAALAVHRLRRVSSRVLPSTAARRTTPTTTGTRSRSRTGSPGPMAAEPPGRFTLVLRHSPTPSACRKRRIAPRYGLGRRHGGTTGRLHPRPAPLRGRPSA